MKLKDLLRVVKAMANERRIHIVKYLRARERATVGSIADNVKLSFKATSKHLAVLFAADIVQKEQVSLNVAYSLQKPLCPLVKSILAELDE